jgi:hypothetical protein
VLTEQTTPRFDAVVVDLMIQVPNEKPGNLRSNQCSVVFDTFTGGFKIITTSPAWPNADPDPTFNIAPIIADGASRRFEILRPINDSRNRVIGFKDGNSLGFLHLYIIDTFSGKIWMLSLGGHYVSPGRVVSIVIPLED